MSENGSIMMCYRGIILAQTSTSCMTSENETSVVRLGSQLVLLGNSQECIRSEHGFSPVLAQLRDAGCLCMGQFSGS